MYLLVTSKRSDHIVLYAKTKETVKDLEVFGKRSWLRAENHRSPRTALPRMTSNFMCWKFPNSDIKMGSLCDVIRMFKIAPGLTHIICVCEGDSHLELRLASGSVP